MFERFTQDARAVIVEAVRDAATLEAVAITPLDILAALMRFPGSGAGRVLAGLGVSIDDVAAEAGRVRRRGGLSEADTAALREFGLDVDPLIERIEQAHDDAHAATKGRWKRKHVPFADASKQTLRVCLEETARLGGRRQLGSEHILLALAAQRGPAADVLARFDVDATRLRQILMTQATG